MKKDYYEILGVPKESTLPQIKKAYRSLALKFHPDRVPAEQKKEAEERFKEISEAYGVLSDPQKRQMYDQYGHAGIDQRYTAEDIFRGADFSSIFEDLGIGDIFSQMFGGGGFDFFETGRQRTRAQRGRDIQYEVEVTLEEAYTGVKKKITVPRHDLCPECSGTGAKRGSSPQTCSTCKGRGQIFMSSGFFKMSQSCTACGGHGQIIKDYCPQCHGKGVIRIDRPIEVSIPSGVSHDSRLRVRGEGEYGPSGRGDLYLYINIKPHPVFERNGNDIYMELSISFVKAALGAEVSVPTLNGNVSMKIPSGTQSGKLFRLKDKGMPDIHGGGQGDQYARIMIEVPTRLTAEQKKLLEEYARISGEDINHREASIKDKIKNVFK